MIIGFLIGLWVVVIIGFVILGLIGMFNTQAINDHTRAINDHTETLLIQSERLTDLHQRLTRLEKTVRANQASLE